MQTVFETRKQRLRLLKKNYKHWGDLNLAIGWERADPRLSQIHSEVLRKDRGTPYVMGDTTARTIEEKLALPEGWMDTPPTYTEMHGEHDPRVLAMEVMESLNPEDWATALRLLSALKKPQAKNGTTN